MKLSEFKVWYADFREKLDLSSSIPANFARDLVKALDELEADEAAKTAIK